MATSPNDPGARAEHGVNPQAERRPYNSPVRRQRAAETRTRIVVAGSELAHSFPSWEWRDLTFRAVAERAGVGERTVYRHFPTERLLRDAVMQRLEEEAGVTYEDVTLDNLAEVAGRVFESIHRYAVDETAPRPQDPTFADADDRRRTALLRAVQAAAPQLPEAQQETAAALLDVVWNLPSYERLVGAWGFEPDRATEAIGWLIERVATAVDDDEALPT